MEQPASLFTRDGRRKYLNGSERTRFIATARRCARGDLGTLCLVIAFSGCRISEALAITPQALDSDDGFVVIRSLKKRGHLLFRQVPLPDEVVARVNELRVLSEPDEPLWPWCRAHAWYLIKQVMREAEIAPGPWCTPKGLRHAFGIHAIRCKVPLNMVQRWLGHSRLSTTAIYTEAIGPEERELASLMWSEDP